MSPNRAAALVVVIAATVMFTNLGGPRLWDRDEPRNAGCAREMLARWDWVTPVFNDELRSHKPVLLYWLIMSAYSLFGVSEFSARFWSAGLAVGTALCTWSLGRRLFGPRTGLWAGVIVSTSLLLAVVGRAATPDAALVFFSTLALTIYVHGTFAGSQRGILTGVEKSAAAVDGDTAPSPLVTHQAGAFFPRSWLTVAGMYAAMGLAILTKGPVGLILPTAVIGMFLLIVRLPARAARQTAARSVTATVAAGFWDAVRCFAPLHFLRTCWMMRPVTALAVSLAIALPWYIWVGIRTDGEFLRAFFLEHNLGRARFTMEGHAGAVWFYPATILVGFFPWSVLCAPIVAECLAGLKRGDPRRPGFLFALCWLGVYVGAFTLAQTKLPNYVLPCYPALALLAGSVMQRWAAGQLAGWILWRRLAIGSLITVGLALAVGLPLVAQRFLPGEEWLGVIGAIPIIGGIACFWCMEHGQSQRSAVLLSGTALAFVTVLVAGAAHRVSAHQQNSLLLDEIARHGSETKVAAFGLLEPTWIFYGNRPIPEVHWSGDRVAMGQWVENGGAWQPKPPLGLDDLLEHDGESLLITTERQLPQLESLVGSGLEVLADVPFFLRDDRLLLLRLGKDVASTARRGASRELK